MKLEDVWDRIRLPEDKIIIAIDIERKKDKPDWHNSIIAPKLKLNIDDFQQGIKMLVGLRRISGNISFAQRKNGRTLANYDYLEITEAGEKHLKDLYELFEITI